MLSRVECLKILELGPGADQYEIENRYTMLIKRYRGHADDDSAAQLDQITMAYNILTGRYIEPEPENPRLEQVVMGKSLRQWKNIWHYGRLPLLAGLIGAAVLIYFIYTVATNKPPDFQIGFIGLFGKTEPAEENVEGYILEMFPDFDEIEVLTIPMDLSSIDSEPDPSESGSSGGGYLYEYMMKMLTLMVGDTYEVYVCDQLVFDRYAPQGAFADLADFYAEIQQRLPADVLAKIQPLYRASDDGDEETADSEAEQILYGLDVSALQLTEGLGFYNDAQILTIGIKASAADEAHTFLMNWILDYEEMHARQSEYESTLPSASE